MVLQGGGGVQQGDGIQVEDGLGTGMVAHLGVVTLNKTHSCAQVLPPYERNELYTCSFLRDRSRHGNFHVRYRSGIRRR